jgi:DNA-binding response OmpR family regulator
MAIARILLADDEPNLVWAVQRSLSDEGYEVLTARDGIEALALAERQHPDLIILDITMPRLDGLQVCQRLRRDPELAAVPILFLTARSAVEDRIIGIDEGADDYLSKPFDLRELKARIRGILRRSRSTSAAGDAHPDAEPCLTVGALTLDLDTCQVTIEGRIVPLTPAELDLLRFLMCHPRHVFSSQQLLQEVWGYSTATADLGLVRWHIMNLRTKIEPDPAHPIYIRTVPRHGYLLDQG